MASASSALQGISGHLRRPNSPLSPSFAAAPAVVPCKHSKDMQSRLMKKLAASAPPSRSFSCKAQASASGSPQPDSTGVQQLYVYEINERDRGSPAYLRLSQKDVNSLGDLVPFSNKIYSGDLQKRLGITAGICILIEHKEEKKGDRYEAVYSFYFGEYGQLAVQGPYLTYEDTWLTVTGGTGAFDGARGKVRLHQIIFPFKLFYTFYLEGIKELPEELVVTPEAPSPAVEASPAAKACEPHATVEDFTN